MFVFFLLPDKVLSCLTERDILGTRSKIADKRYRSFRVKGYHCNFMAKTVPVQ